MIKKIITTAIGIGLIVGVPASAGATSSASDPEVGTLAACATSIGGEASVASLGSVSPASSPCCVAQTSWVITSVGTRKPYPNVPIYKNGPGGKMTITNNAASSLSYSVTAGGSAEVNTVFAKAKVELSANITKTKSSGTSNAYTKTITAGKYGNAQLVNWGETVSWKKVVLNSVCKTTTTTGKVWFPVDSIGWYYWETNS